MCETGLCASECARIKNEILFHVLTSVFTFAPHSPSPLSLLALLGRNSAKAVSSPSLPSLMHEGSERINLLWRPVVHSLCFAHHIIVSRNFPLSPVDILRIRDNVKGASAPRLRYARVRPGDYQRCAKHSSLQIDGTSVRSKIKLNLFDIRTMQSTRDLGHGRCDIADDAVLLRACEGNRRYLGPHRLAHTIPEAPARGSGELRVSVNNVLHVLYSF